MKRGAAGRSRSGRAAVIGVPYGWLLIFFLLPFLVVLRISFSEMEGASFSDLVTFEDGVPALHLHSRTYALLLHDAFYLTTYLSSLKYALVTTLICLLIAYPFSYFMARSRGPAAGVADAGDAAVLDLVPAARLRLEGVAGRARLGVRPDVGRVLPPPPRQA